MRPRSHGFTLVEVLIAASILFFSITVITEAYRASLLSSRRADIVARMLAPLPLIVGNIRNTLRESGQPRVTGEGKALGVDFAFEADTLRFESSATQFNADEGAFVDSPPRFRLYRVTLIVQAEGQRRELEYKEIAWLPL
jgi:hypothetical protein